MKIFSVAVSYCFTQIPREYITHSTCVGSAVSGNIRERKSLNMVSHRHSLTCLLWYYMTFLSQLRRWSRECLSVLFLCCCSSAVLCSAWHGLLFRTSQRRMEMKGSWCQATKTWIWETKKVADIKQSEKQLLRTSRAGR